MTPVCRPPCFSKSGQDNQYSSPPSSSGNRGEGRRKSILSSLKKNKSTDKLPDIDVGTVHQALATRAANSKNTVPDSDELWASLLSMFPDICPEFVAKEYRDLRKKYGAAFDEQHLINAIAERPWYPKRINPRDLDPGNLEEFGGPKRVRAYHKSAIKILRLDYPNVPSRHVKTTMREIGTLFRAHLALHDAESLYSQDPENRSYRRRSRKREYHPSNMPPIDRLRLDNSCRPVLVRELEAARARRKASIDEGEENIDLRIMECQCCFSDYPVNMMISCTGPEPHFFCPVCVRTYAQTTIGAMGFQLKCMCMTGCDAAFSKRKLEKVLGTLLCDKLGDIEQQRDIQAAGLDDLEDCPFCDFKAIAPPVEEDGQFACQNPNCRKVSCRLCRRRSHVPWRCKEIEKDEHIPARRTIEEAMTRAVIRRCPASGCGMPMIKEDGCNKMECPRCHWVLCYVCRESILTYSHFDDDGKGDRCPLYEVSSSTDRQHDVEAGDARDKTTREVLDADPSLRVEHIESSGPELPGHREKRRSSVDRWSDALSAVVFNPQANNSDRPRRGSGRGTGHGRPGHRHNGHRRHRRNLTDHLNDDAKAPAGTYHPPWFMADVTPAEPLVEHDEEDLPIIPETGPGSYRPPWRLARAPTKRSRASFESPRLPGTPTRAYAT